MLHTIAGKWMPPNAKLTFTLPTGVDFSISGKRDKSKPVPDEVRLTIFSEDMFKQCITRQDIGLGEAYMNNDFSGDVMAFLDLICSGHPSKQEKSNRKKGLSNPKKNWFNPKELVAAILSILGGAAEMAAHKALSNTKEGSKKNIEYHYDAGNAFYSLFLDSTMLYSSGIHGAIGEPMDVAVGQARIAAIQAAITSHAWPSFVRVVDMHTGFDTSVHTYDGLHPNAAGQA